MLNLRRLNYSWLSRWIKGDAEAVAKNQAAAGKQKKLSNCHEPLLSARPCLLAWRAAPCNDKQSDLFSVDWERKEKHLMTKAESERRCPITPSSRLAD